MVQQFHGPLLSACLSEAAGSDAPFKQLMHDTLHGFPLAGELPPCEGASRQGRPKSYPKQDLQANDLRAKRNELNSNVLAAMKSLLF